MEELSLFDFLPNGERYKPIKSSDWKWNMATDYPTKNGLTVFSCFSGGGGSTMGYKLCGCEVIGNLELDKKMNEVYLLNHNPKHNFLMDIRDFNNIPNNELPEELFNLDILDGSPPCTTFSMAGQREKSWGAKKKFREGQKEQTLDDLSFVFIDTVAKLKPKVVIMENVEGLIKGNAWAYVQKIYKQFNDIGYKVKHWLLKGETMGVPQTRHRVFFIATRLDFDFDRLDMSFNYEPITYGEIKQGKTRKFKGKFYDIVNCANDKDKCIADTKVRLGEKCTAFQTYYLRDNEIVMTVRSKPDIIDMANKEYISWESIRNSQTFPQDYKFTPNSISNVGYICGMSVPPIMIKRIVTRLIESKIFDYKLKML